MTRLLDGRHHLERFTMEQAGEVDYLITRTPLTPCSPQPQRKDTPGRDDRRRAPVSRPADILTEAVRRTHRDDWNRHRGPRPEIARRN